MIARKLKQFLDKEGVPYSLIPHPTSYTAQETAESAHISGARIAKTVMVDIDGEIAMMVLPANRKVNLQDLREITGADHVIFASENEFEGLFPGCETGAMPPFGNLYGMEVYVSPDLAEQDEIAFNAGNHHELIKLAYKDFQRLVQPQVLSFSA